MSFLSSLAIVRWHRLPRGAKSERSRRRSPDQYVSVSEWLPTILPAVGLRSNARKHLFAAAAGLLLATNAGQAHAAGACDRATVEAFKACNLSAESDFNNAIGMCDNVKAQSDRQSCISQAANDHTAAQKLCDRQQTARQKVCNALGQAPYDPAIRPSEFFSRITNPLLSLTPGDVRTYRSGKSTVIVTVTDQTIKLLGVTCLVVRDVNTVNGVTEEDTSDYYAQDRDGNVWYFGEDTIAYDKGVASTEGSWRSGVDGAKPGIVMFAHPQLGVTYRQEFLLGTAEDMAKNIAFNQHVTVPFGTFNNAFETLEFSPLEPGSTESKYYVPGTGQVLSVDLDTGEREELVSFTHR
jgi:hypothetical protein